jgi:hypothetical protein
MHMKRIGMPIVKRATALTKLVVVALHLGDIVMMVATWALGRGMTTLTPAVMLPTLVAGVTRLGATSLGRSASLHSWRQCRMPAAGRTLAATTAG